jgi:hypothetical protein
LRLLGDDERSHSMHVATEDARDRWEHADPLVPWDQTVTLHGRNEDEAVEVRRASVVQLRLGTLRTFAAASVAHVAWIAVD